MRLNILVSGVISILLFDVHVAYSLCHEGDEVECTAPNGCPGTKTCAGGHFAACQADESCGIGADDLLTVSNAEAGQDVGMLFDGMTGRIAFNDLRINGVADSSGNFTQNVGDIRSNPAGNGVAAFSKHRAPTWISANWTKFMDRPTDQLEGVVGFPVTIWVVAGPFNQQSRNAALAAVGANSIYGQERVGLQEISIDIIDATNNPNASKYLAFSDEIRGITNDIGKNGGQINIYWVQTV